VLPCLACAVGLDAPTRPQIESAMQGHVLATGELVGTYQRTGLQR
jgi:phosphatidylethanolamine-binding protein (PEBP) family uncharacterized protein